MDRQTGALLPVTLPNAAVAQGNPTVTNVVPESAAISFIARIKSIDRATRDVALEGRCGATVQLIAGPTVRREMLKAGDTAETRYDRSVAFVVSKPQSDAGAPIAGDSMTAVLARPAPTTARGSTRKIGARRTASRAGSPWSARRTHAARGCSGHGNMTGLRHRLEPAVFVCALLDLVRPGNA